MIPMIMVWFLLLVFQVQHVGSLNCAGGVKTVPYNQCKITLAKSWTRWNVEESNQDARGFTTWEIGSTIIQGCIKGGYPECEFGVEGTKQI